MSEVRTITYTPPANFSETDRNLFYFIDGSEQVVEPNVLVKKNVALHAGSRTVLDNGLKSRFKIVLAHVGTRYLLVKTDKPLVQITDRYSTNYFHWISEALPKLIVMREKGFDAMVVLAERYKALSFVTDSLTMLGWSYGFYSDNSIIKSPIVYVPEMTAGSGSQHPVYFNAVKNALLAATGCNAITKGESVFISRQNTPTRKLVNWDEVKAVLDRNNIRIVELETLSLAEQIKLLHNTSVLIGVHGAGLTNMCFMYAGSKIVEIRRDDDKLNFCYYKMANTCGLQYYYQLAGSWSKEVSSIQADDFVVQPQELGRLLSSIQYNK